jgi:type IV pilus assembly protein PilM
MASTGAVWVIDIGQCALKAMRCSLAEDGETLVADAFDFIEYPKILTEPDADPEKLVKDALKQFLADNSVRNTKVAISVPGQSGLARFIKLPPVEAKKIPDIVKYEAKQQIPFSLDDVIWDYQKLGGGMQDEGVALETEVGLFAMKRDQVFRALRPFRDAGIELDIVQ